MLSPSRPKKRRAARGTALVEFALVSLAFYLLVAAVLTFGQVLHTAQVAQDAARLAARELALTPLPADSTFDEALANPVVRQRVYSVDALVIDLDAVPGGVPLDTYVAQMPSVNRALKPLMIYDVVEIDGATRRLLRVPGAIVRRPSAPSGLSVAIPRVVSRDAAGHETVDWVAVLEEVRVDPDDPATGPFSVTPAAGTPDRGLVAVRINIPAQSASMGAYKPGATPLDPTIGSPIAADDAAVVETESAPGTLAAGSATPGFETNGGAYGMGQSHMQAMKARPFRRLVSAQAMLRREVFAEQSQQ